MPCFTTYGMYIDILWVHCSVLIMKDALISENHLQDASLNQDAKV